MSQIRFHVDDLPPTEWIDELVVHGPSEHTAVTVISQLRALHPTAAVRIERRGAAPPKPQQLYRYRIAVRNGTVPVVPNPENPTGTVQLTNTVLHSRSFQASDDAAVVAEIRTMLPDAELTKEVV